MGRSNFVVAALLAITLGAAGQAEQIPVVHIQRPMHRFMVVCSMAGKIIAKVEFSQIVQADEVTMHLIYRFVDGSIDDEMSTYSQRGTFQLISDRHIQKGPFFSKPIDFAVDVSMGTVTGRTSDKDGKVQIKNEHMDLPKDLANGFVGTLLLNVPYNTAPFRVPLLVPVSGGRLIRLLISQEGEQSFYMAGQSRKSAMFRIHPELGGIVGLIALLIGAQPKDVTVWVMEGDAPEVVKIVGQLGGYGPVVDSELEGASFAK